MDKNAGIHKDFVQTEEHDDNSDNSDSIDDDVSINSSKRTDNSFFDPPLENYRFYYQAGKQ